MIRKTYHVKLGPVVHTQTIIVRGGDVLVLTINIEEVHMTRQRKAALLEQLAGIEKNGGVEAAIASIVKEMLEALPMDTTEHEDAVSNAVLDATEKRDRQ